MSGTNGLSPRELFDEYRRRISEEHTLLSNRVGWLLVTQSFLFGPLSVALRPDGELWLRIMIPVMGAGICVTLTPSIRAAVDTLRVFVARERALVREHPELAVLNADIGTPKRNQGTFRRSVSYVRWFPVGLLVVWLTVLTMVLVTMDA